MISRDMVKIALVPPIPQKHWVAAQRLMRKGLQNLAFKLGSSFVIPSEHLLSLIPEDSTQVADQRAFLKKWAMEYIAMRRNPKSYYKLTNGEWDFNILNDMMFSFWVVTEITEHKQKEGLKEKGIVYQCNCPQFNHYFECKHALLVGLWQKKVCVRWTLLAAWRIR